MAFYNICPLCNASLDPGEKCDCQDKRQEEERSIQRLLMVGRGGQLQMRFSQGVDGVAPKTMV